MPRAERAEPLHLQISGYYKQRILSGELAVGERLPSVRDIAAEWGVGQNAAQRAVEHLRTERLIETSARGAFVAPERAVIGPQQRIRLAGPAASETIVVRSAGLVAAPEYVVPILGLDDPVVLRREQVTYDTVIAPRPRMLSVSWFSPRASAAVPELLAEEPLPGDASALIARRTGREVAWGRNGIEARPAKDDGREVPLLGLAPGGCVLAGVYTWVASDGEVLEYAEYVLPQGRVIESDMEP